MGNKQSHSELEDTSARSGKRHGGGAGGDDDAEEVVGEVPPPMQPIASVPLSAAVASSSSASADDAKKVRKSRSRSLGRFGTLIKMSIRRRGSIRAS